MPILPIFDYRHLETYRQNIDKNIAWLWNKVRILKMVSEINSQVPHFLTSNKRTMLNCYTKGTWQAWFHAFKGQLSTVHSNMCSPGPQRRENMLVTSPNSELSNSVWIQIQPSGLHITARYNSAFFMAMWSAPSLNNGAHVLSTDNILEKGYNPNWHWGNLSIFHGTGGGHWGEQVKYVTGGREVTLFCLYHGCQNPWKKGT